MYNMYNITITQTRVITIPCEASSKEEALSLIAKEYFDNHASALCDDKDWDYTDITITANKPITYTGV